MDFVLGWSGKTEIAIGRFLGWIELGSSKFYDWRQRYGKVNEHNAWVPRDHWLTEEEKRSIITFAHDHPLDGYRRQTFMMLDADVVAASPTSVWRVLHQAGLLARVNGKPSRKGTGFVQPLRPHQHWHVDISYLNIGGTFYFLCSILDGYSRFIVHWEIRENMGEGVVETIIQRAREMYPNERPRIITDNGPQFIAKDFKEFIRICGMTHVKTSPYYPQSNGKIERFHRTIKGDCIRTQTPLSLEDARRLVTNYVAHYNEVRLHSAIGYIAPKDMLAGRAQEIFAARDHKLAEARERRKTMRQTVDQGAATPPRPSIDFTAVRAAITLAEVLALLQFVPNRTRGAEQRGPCPVHGTRNAARSQCFSANVAQNIWHCFRCGKGGNALGLWMAATGQNAYDAVVDLCQRLGRPLPTKGCKQRPHMTSQQTAEQRREPVALGEEVATT
ncbi:MAG TPA: DDE-type integrase/transposase/recombinase [Gemmataceae bacterium]|nr:DDE-type integrase/transposase/recombinase [Gemmataceae bacterium]